MLLNFIEFLQEYFVVMPYSSIKLPTNPREFVLVEMICCVLSFVSRVDGFTVFVLFQSKCS